MISRGHILISAAIVAFWLVMMGLLVRDYVLLSGRSGGLLDITPSLLTEEWRDYEEWMSLRIGARSKGVSYTVIRRHRPTAGYLACNRIWLDLEMFGGRFPFRLETVALLNGAFHLKRASAKLHLDNSEMKFAAMTTPSRLFFRWDLEGRTRVGSQNLATPISLLEAIQPLVTQRIDLEVGKTYRLAVLESTWSMREGVAEIRVEAKENIAVAGERVEALRLAIVLGPFGSTIWVSPDGEILRREFANNIVMERIDPGTARRNQPGIDSEIEPPSVRVSDFTRGEDDGQPLGAEAGPLKLLLDLFRNPTR